MKKRFLGVILGLLCLLTIGGCGDGEVNTDTSVSSISKAESMTNTTNSANMGMTDTTREDMIESDSPSEETLTYSEALSEEEIKDLQQMAEDFYNNDFPYDLISIKPMDDDKDRMLYEGYAPGTVFGFWAETTHAGEGVYRMIIFGKNDQGEWERINEGY